MLAPAILRSSSTFMADKSMRYSSTKRFCLTVNCDMPLINSDQQFRNARLTPASGPGVRLTTHGRALPRGLGSVIGVAPFAERPRASVGGRGGLTPLLVDFV